MRQMVGSHPSSDSAGVEWGLRLGISNKFPGDLRTLITRSWHTLSEERDHNDTVGTGEKLGHYRDLESELAIEYRIWRWKSEEENMEVGRIPEHR